MPKLKTHQSTAKRVRVTSTGKVVRGKGNQIHFNEKKSESRKRSNAVPTTVTGKIARNLKRALGV